jgi:hypothetical protein
MIKEAYVSFETAKLLKEKGFDEGCSFVVNAISKGVMPVSWPTTNSDIEDEKASLIALPTLQMAMAWLREVHNMYYEIHLLLGEKAEEYAGLQLGIYQLNSSGAYVWKDWIYADTYIELYENYIKYCLENLI